MNSNSKLVSLILWFVAACSIASTPAFAYDEVLLDLYQEVPFDMPQVALPEIPSYEISVEKFNAVGNGVFDNTTAFRDALRHLSKKGGGRLTVPRGIWSTGPIELKSNVELHVEQGALIKFIPLKDKYPLIKTNYEGRSIWRPVSPIYGINLENVAITGKGIIDGSGNAWRMVKKDKLTSNQWKRLLESGGVLSNDKRIWYPSEESKKGNKESRQYDIFKYSKQQAQAIKHFLRPVMVAIVNSDKILLDGPTFQNSPAWNIHILMSQNVVVRNLQIRNPWYSQNGDGLDLDSVKNALVYNNSFDVGDDAICIKSGRDKEGRLRGQPSENMIIKNNVVYHAHGGIVVGSEMSSGVKNIFFSKATFIGTDIGIRFKTTRGRGGVVENIWISDIDMTDIVYSAISFNMYYQNKAPADASKDHVDTSLRPVDETTPAFKNVSIQNIRALNVGLAALLQGLPERNLKNVNIENSYFESKTGIKIIDANELRLSNVTLYSDDKTSVILRNAKNIEFNNIKLNDSRSIEIEGEKSDNIIFKNKKTDSLGFEIKLGKNIKENAVSIRH